MYFLSPPTDTAALKVILLFKNRKLAGRMRDVLLEQLDSVVHDLLFIDDEGPLDQQLVARTARRRDLVAHCALLGQESHARGAAHCGLAAPPAAASAAGVCGEFVPHGVEFRAEIADGCFQGRARGRGVLVQGGENVELVF